MSATAAVNAAREITTLVGQLFLDDEEVVVLNALSRLQPPVIADNRVTSLIAIQEKKLRGILQRLVVQGLVRLEAKVQSDEELLDYYYIDYEYLTRVVTYKLHMMKERLQTAEQRSTLDMTEAYICTDPECGRRFTAIESLTLAQAPPGTFSTGAFAKLCNECNKPVRPLQHVTESSQGGHAKMQAKLHRQTTQLQKLLRLVADQPLPRNTPSLLYAPKRTSTGGGRGAGGGGGGGGQGGAEYCGGSSAFSSSTAQQSVLQDLLSEEGMDRDISELGAIRVGAPGARAMAAADSISQLEQAALREQQRLSTLDARKAALASHPTFLQAGAVSGRQTELALTNARSQTALAAATAQASGGVLAKRLERIKQMQADRQRMLEEAKAKQQQAGAALPSESTAPSGGVALLPVPEAGAVEAPFVNESESGLQPSSAASSSWEQLSGQRVQVPSASSAVVLAAAGAAGEAAHTPAPAAPVIPVQVRVPIASFMPSAAPAPAVTPAPMPAPAPADDDDGDWEMA